MSHDLCKSGGSFLEVVWKSRLAFQLPNQSGYQSNGTILQHPNALLLTPSKDRLPSLCTLTYVDRSAAK